MTTFKELSSDVATRASDVVDNLTTVRNTCNVDEEKWSWFNELFSAITVVAEKASIWRDSDAVVSGDIAQGKDCVATFLTDVQDKNLPNIERKITEALEAVESAEDQARPEFVVDLPGGREYLDTLLGAMRAYCQFLDDQRCSISLKLVINAY